MGTFKIEITAVGGHGVDRETKNDEIVNFYKEGVSTPDAIAKSFVEHLKLSGVNVEIATIRHWPDQDFEVKDDLLTGIRKGNF